MSNFIQISFHNFYPNVFCEIDPNDFEAHNNCGNLFFELGKLDLAFQNFDKAIKINSSYADGHYNRANTLYELGEFENSIVSYKEAIKINPHLDFLLGKLIYVKSRNQHLEQELNLHTHY